MRRLAAIVTLALSLSCSRAPRAPDWSSFVADRHAEADRLIDGGDRAGARRVLAAILSTAPEAPVGPPGSGAARARRVLLQDTQFRLARLALEAREPAEAARHADAGLALGGDPDLFVANLLVVRGAAHEALGETAAAVSVYDRALRINEALLHETLPPP